MGLVEIEKTTSPSILPQLKVNMLTSEPSCLYCGDSTWVECTPFHVIVACAEIWRCWACNKSGYRLLFPTGPLESWPSDLEIDLVDTEGGAAFYLPAFDPSDAIFAAAEARKSNGK